MRDKVNQKCDICAVVMAGGEGARLRPITHSIPKPLAPIAGEPVLSHMLRLLGRSGIKAAALTLLYKGEQIADLYGDSFEGVKIRSVYEIKPLGTAGSVKGTADFINLSDSDVFVVVSGDAVCDINLQEVIKFHRSQGAEATLVLTKVKNPLEYGIVIGDMEGDGGKIEGFIEKPPYSLAYSDLVNTGIYVLSKSVLDSIPSGVSYDFARDLFSKMLGDGRALYGYVFDGYWCDIGSPEAYRRCCIDAAGGRIRGIFGRFSFERSVIGIDCKIGEGTKIVRSVLQDCVTVGKNCIIEDAIICSEAQVGDGVTLKPGCVIGPKCKIGSGACIETGVRIEAGVEIIPGAQVDGGGGDSYDNLIYEEEIKLSDISVALKAGSAVARAAKGGPVGFSHDGSDVARKMYEFLLEGARNEGGRVYSLGRTHRQIAAFGARKFELEATGYLRFDGKSASLVLFDRNGQVQPHSSKRTFAREMSELPHRADTDKEPIKDVSESLLYAYIDSLMRQGGGRFGLVGARIYVEGGEVERLFARAAEGCGAVLCADSEENCFTCVFDGNGQLVRFGQVGEGRSFTFECDRAHARAIVLNHLPCENTSVSIACTEPLAYDKILRGKGCTVTRYSTVPADKGEDPIREKAALVPWLLDDLFAAMALIRLAVNKGSDLIDLGRGIPPFGSVEFKLDASLSDPSGLVRHFSRIAREQSKGAKQDEYPVGGDGIVLTHKGGFARILVPSNQRIRVICDGMSVEAAQELAGFTKKDIENYLQKADKQTNL